MSEGISDKTPDDRTPPPRLTLGTRRVSANRAEALLGAATPRFSQPVRQILLMLTALTLVLVGAWFTYGRILPIFVSNLWLNGLILAVFALGVLACFWQVGQLVRSVSWIERFAARRRTAGEGDPADWDAAAAAGVWAIAPGWDFACPGAF